MTLSTAARKAYNSQTTQRFAHNVFQNVGGGDLHSAVGRSLTGSTYKGGRGFQALPSRTQAQQSTFGINSAMPSAMLTGQGALQLDRGFRQVRRGHMTELPMHEMHQSGGPGLGPQWGGGDGRPAPIRATATYQRPAAFAMGPAPSTDNTTAAPAGGFDLGSIDVDHVAETVTAAAARVGQAATGANDRLNRTMNRPVVGRVVKAGMKATPMGRAALFANGAMNSRAKKATTSADDLPF